MTILKSLQSWEDRVKRLDKKKEDIDVLEEEVRTTEAEIFKVYLTLFKNFVVKRIDTNVEEKTTNSYSKRTWCLNKEGFSILSKYATNSDYISRFNSLKDVLSNSKELLEHLQKKEKKKLVRIWAKEFSRIKETTLKFEIVLKNPKKLQMIERIYNVKKIRFFSGSIDLYEDVKDVYGGDENITFGNLNTDNYIIIEQFYTLINKILDNHKKKMLRMRKERGKILVNIRSHFSSELILEELKKEN